MVGVVRASGAVGVGASFGETALANFHFCNLAFLATQFSDSCLVSGTCDCFVRGGLPSVRPWKSIKPGRVLFHSRVEREELPLTGSVQFQRSSAAGSVVSLLIARRSSASSAILPGGMKHNQNERWPGRPLRHRFLWRGASLSPLDGFFGGFLGSRRRLQIRHFESQNLRFHSRA
jgi:hypothetical protein